MKNKIDPSAYNALIDALSVIYWNKKPWARYLKAQLQNVPEILARLDIETDTKRETAGQLIDYLMSNEDKYQALTISLMLNVSEMDSFPNLTSQPDNIQMVATAEKAVAELRKWTAKHQDIAKVHRDYADKLAAAAKQATRVRAFSSEIAKLKSDFLSMHSDGSNPQKRGLKLEVFINDLFKLHDLDPRAAYSLEREQIDGAFSFDTDDYILEGRWWKESMSRDHLDVFAKKVERKGRNALGLYVSINGFTKDALDEYSHSSPFITMDGMDFFAILEERVRLDELLRRKKRHVNETGSCHYPAKNLF